MFGWEFPPMKSGGLGTACYDLCRGLSLLGVDVTFVVPKLPKDMKSEIVKLVGANVHVTEVDTLLTPYMTMGEYNEEYANLPDAAKRNYGKTLFAEVEQYAKKAAAIAKKIPHDLIHSHDWMTYQAGAEARRVSGKPLVMHLHASEFDRTADNPNWFIAHEEYKGLEAADLVITNSNYTKNNILKHYQIPSQTIRVVHWGVDEDNPSYHLRARSPFSKTVLFLGRVTIQKGPDYFIQMAKRVIPYVPDVHFVVAGSGDMLPRTIDEVNAQGLAKHFTFTGFLEGEEVHKAFQMADLYVMPSVSEPFGLVALESMKNGTPILVSKQSGVSEVVQNAFKVDFWDVNEMSNKIVSFLRYPALNKELTKMTKQEAKQFNIEKPAKECLECYKEALW